MGKLQLVKSTLLCLLVIVFGVIQLGCGGKSQEDIPPVEEGNNVGSFSFQALPESLIDEASSEFTHYVIRTGSTVVVDIEAQGASGLKALYFELDYDAEAYHPVAVEYTDLLGETGELLTIDVTSHAGKVFCGQVLRNYPTHAGFTGNGTLATVRFEEGAVPHVASIPPTAESSKVIPQFVAPGVVSWLYSNTGDYDQNSEVNVADLTQIALNYGATGPFDPESALWMVDGDFNGEINLADITPIAINYESTVTNYQLMAAPILPGGEDPLMFGVIEFENGISEEGRRLSFVAEIVGDDGTTPDIHAASYFSVYDPNEDFYWDYQMNVTVVPNDDEDDGIESDPFTDEPDIQVPFLELSNPPSAGNGRFTNPYILYRDDDLASNPLSFMLTHPTAGDITASEKTRFFVNTFDFGGFDPATPGLFQFNAPPIPKGVFHISTIYEGKFNFPRAIYFVVLPRELDPPVLGLINPPAEGSGTAEDPYIADVATKYIFSVTSEGTDVSTHSGLRYNTTPIVAGYISARNCILDIKDDYKGLLTVKTRFFGTFNTKESNIVMQVGTELNLEPDTLYAIPMTTEVQVGEPVTVVVATGTSAAPFIYMNLVTVAAGVGANYVPGTFNLGSIGGAKEDVDGCWTSMEPPFTILPNPDSFISSPPNEGTLEFNISPISGTNTIATGELFNFQMEFDSPGTYTLRFVKEGRVPRTYYSGQTEVEFFWGDITNNHPGIPNTITVFDGGAGDGGAYKSASVPPTNDQSKVQDLVWNIDTSRFNWTYANVGDYDQNGEVNSADITKIAVHFAEHPLGNPVARVADGDRNGEVNVADITPIAMNLGMFVSGYNIYASPIDVDYPETNGGPNGAGSILLGNVSLTDSIVGRFDGMLEFSFQASDPAQFCWVRPADNTLEGTPSNLVQTNF